MKSTSVSPGSERLLFASPIAESALLLVPQGVNYLLGLSCVPVCFAITFLVTYVIGFEDLPATKQ